MAPLSCALVEDIYGPSFNNSNSRGLVIENLKNNEECVKKNKEYQENLKVNEIAGKANFVEVPNKVNEFPNKVNEFPNKLNELPNKVNEVNGIPPRSINNSQFATRMGYTDYHNNFPNNHRNSMFDRFQGLFGNRENYTEFLDDKDCMRHLVSLVKELLLVLKIIMLILVLLFLIKILEKKN